MNTTPLLIAGLAASLAAQNPDAAEIKVPRPPQVGFDLKLPAPPVAKLGATPATAGARPAAPLTDPKPLAGPTADAIARRVAEDVFFDVDPRGTLLAAAGDYKAQFTPEGFLFVARPVDPTANAQPIRFATTAASVGGTALSIGASAPVRQGRRITWQRGGFVEAVDFSARGAEQTFTFATLPQRGELLVTVAVATDRLGQDRGQGILFVGTAGDVHYSEAVAIDATGRRVTAPTEYHQGAITIRVPAAFVASAVLPLVIDPLANSGTAYTNSATLSHPDIAFDASSQSYMVAFERWFSADDIDVYCQRLDSLMQPVGSITTVDTSLDVWQRPRLAGLDLHDRYLVVAQVSTDAPAPYWIAGRVVSNTGALLTSQFDIERPSLSGFPGDKLAPDVGGDPFLTGPVYWTVVWERVASPTDHDVHMKQVQFDGTLRTNSVTLIQNNSDFQTAPAISKSDGPGPGPQQRWCIVYEETFSAADHDILGCLVTWDGQITPVAGNATFGIDRSSTSHFAPEVSSPTDAAIREFLVVYESPFVNGGDIEATCIDSGGGFRARGNINGIENSVAQAWPQYYPCVDTDGSRFAVCYTELFNGAGSDQDVRTTLVARAGAQLVAHESRVTTAFTSEPETFAAIASNYSGSGARNVMFGITNVRIGATNLSIDADSYAGYGPGGGFAVRQTACGNLTINPYGLPVLGQTFGFTFTQTYPLMGFVAGFPASQPIGPCPACTLGVNGNALLTTTYALTVPGDAALFGVQLAVQGFAFSGGSCLGSISVSDTYDVTLR